MDATNPSSSTVINLCGFGLKSFPIEIIGGKTEGNVSNLARLYLGGNEIGELPRNLGDRYPDLEVLWFGGASGGNKLNRLPNSISKLTKLTSLNLGNNQFEEIPPVVFQMTSLKELYLDNNRIKFIPSEISKLSKLNTLRLGSDTGGNPLTFCLKNCVH